MASSSTGAEPNDDANIAASSENNEIPREEAIRWLEQQGFSATLSLVGSGNTPMHAACISGNLAILIWLYGEGFGHEELLGNDLGQIPFMCAVKFGHVSVAKCIYSNSTQKDTLIAHLDNGGNNCAMYATRNGSSELLEWLVSIGGEYILTHKNNSGNDVCTWAVYDESIDAMRWLHERGCKLDEPNNELRTSIMYAAAYGQLEMARWLFQNGCSIDRRDSFGKSIIIQTATAGKLNVLKWLCDTLNVDVCEVDSDRRSSLHYACLNGHLDCVAFLIESGADIHARDHIGFDAILVAANANHHDCIRYLVECGANVNTCLPTSGTTLFMMILLHSSPSSAEDIIRWILNRKECKVNLKLRSTTGSSVACIAVQNDLTLSLLKVLVEYDPDVLKETFRFNSDLAMIAARFGALETLRWLVIEKNFSLTKYDMQTDTVPSYASLYGHLHVVQWIFQTLNVPGPELQGIGSFCLGRASKYGHSDVVRWLVEKQRINPNDGVGIVPPMFAAVSGQIAMLELFDSYSALSKKQDLLAEAARGGSVPAMKWLHQRGFKITHSEKAIGPCAIFNAAKHGHIDAMEWLLRHGASIHDTVSAGQTMAQVAISMQNSRIADWIRSFVQR